MIKGYAGNLAFIDLAQDKILNKSIDDDLALKYLGGRGFVAKILWDELPKNVNPLNPENILIISTGILTGHFVPSANRTIIGSKSPHTNGYADSMMGGFFSPTLKFTGNDALILKNRAPKPIYLLVTEDGITFEDASFLWGKGTAKVEQILKEKHSNKCQVLSIGPAGENLVKYACITHLKGRNAGREGMGAIMGSKNVKAIVVLGDKKPEADNPDKLKALTKKAFKEIKENSFFDAFHKYGTTNVLDFCNNTSILPNRNFSQGQYNDWVKISGKAQREQANGKDKTCWNCPIGCWMLVTIPKYENIESHFAEYETTGMIGTNLELTDPQDLIYANHLCNDLGVDTVSTGSSIAFAIECFEKHIISTKDTDGLELKFGDEKLIFTLIKKIAARDGFGDLLAEGTKKLALKWKNGSMDFAMQVKGNEATAYDTRLLPAMALSFMTADVGAHHNRSWTINDDIRENREIIENKARITISYQHKRPLLDQLGVCRFPWVETQMDYDLYAQFYSAVTGIETSTEQLLISSERVWNLTRCFWIRENQDFNRSWDIPPKRWTEPFDKGPIKGKAMTMNDYNKLLDEYYALRGWDSNGIPTKEKLKSLDLNFVNF
ncbi:MAG: aldehyde ferredoxin oxidoreductase family protein [Candidatus Helarchaeota archaeon]